MVDIYVEFDFIQSYIKSYWLWKSGRDPKVKVKWRAGEMAWKSRASAACSSRELRSESQSPHGSPQLALTPVPENLTSTSSLLQHQAHEVHRDKCKQDAHTHKTKNKMKAKCSRKQHNAIETQPWLKASKYRYCDQAKGLITETERWEKALGSQNQNTMNSLLADNYLGVHETMVLFRTDISLHQCSYGACLSSSFLFPLSPLPQPLDTEC